MNPKPNSARETGDGIGSYHLARAFSLSADGYGAVQGTSVANLYTL